MKEPVVSVLMSVYNEPIEWINVAIQSILSQTYKDFEFIIVLDSPDRSDIKEYLSEIEKKDTRVKIIFNEKNLGLTKSLNVGLNRCRGQYVARMDADDYSLPCRLEKQVAFMDSHPEIVASSAMAVEWDGTKIGKKYYRPVTNLEIQEYLFTSSPFIHPLLIIRRDVLKRNNISYDEHFKVAQDYKLAADLNKIGVIANLNEVLLNYRISTSQISASRGREQEENGRKIRRELIDEYYKTVGLPPLDPDITFGTVKSNYKKSKSLDSNSKRIMNCIRRDMYYSLSQYSIKTFLYFLSSGDYLKTPYNLRRFAVVVAKHLKKNVVPSLL